MTITVALGTSTPTSITVVATSTSRPPERNRAMAFSFSPGVTRPCSSPSREPRQLAGLQALEGLLGRPHLELLALVDERADDVGLAPLGHLLAHLGPHRPARRPRPAPTPVDDRACDPAAARRAPTRRGRRRPSWPRCAGSGVAVMTSTSGTASPALLSRSAARCSTPKRCCSSITTTPSERNSMPSWISAWVPMARSTSPVGQPGQDASPLGRRRAVGEQLDPQLALEPGPANRLASSVSGDGEARRAARARPGGAARPAPRSAP